MIRSIVGASLKFRYIVVAIAAGVMFFGIARLPNTPVDVFPEFAPPRVEIQTPALVSPPRVEALVTVPLEQAFNGLPGLDVMRSKSVPSCRPSSSFSSPGTRLHASRQLVQERMHTVIAHIANLGRSAGHDAAGVVHRPLDEDRNLLKRPCP